MSRYLSGFVGDGGGGGVRRFFMSPVSQLKFICFINSGQN